MMRVPAQVDRVEHEAELTTTLETVFAHLVADDLIQLLDRAGIANARLRAPEDLLRHPQLSARNRWRSIPTPGGPVPALLPPVMVTGTGPVMGAVPALGAHTDAVRAECAGVADVTEGARP